LQLALAVWTTLIAIGLGRRIDRDPIV